MLPISPQVSLLVSNSLSVQDSDLVVDLNFVVILVVIVELKLLQLFPPACVFCHETPEASPST